MELVRRAVPHRRRRQRGRDVRVPAGRLTRRCIATNRRGLANGRRHRGRGAAPVRPLRRRVGHRDGRDRRSRRALADAGVEWRDIQFAFGGSYEVDNPDAVVALLGLTGIPFTDVYNGCATAASALTLAANTIRLGDHDLGIAVGMDKHLPGAFSADPRTYACPSWYGELGQFVTTKFFGMKINKYMHDHGISHSTLAKVAAKNYRNGALNPNAFRRKPLSEEEILGSPMLNYPLTQYMFCSPDEGAAAVVLCQAENAHRYTDTPIYLRADDGAHAAARRVRGAQPVAADRGDARTDGRRVACRVRDGRDRARGRRRHPAPGHRRRRRGHPPRRERLLRRRRPGGARRRRRDSRSTARCR